MLANVSKEWSRVTIIDSRRRLKPRSEDGNELQKVDFARKMRSKSNKNKKQKNGRQEEEDGITFTGSSSEKKQEKNQKTKAPKQKGQRMEGEESRNESPVTKKEKNGKKEKTEKIKNVKKAKKQAMQGSTEEGSSSAKKVKRSSRFADRHRDHEKDDDDDDDDNDHEGPGDDDDCDDDHRFPSPPPPPPPPPPAPPSAPPPSTPPPGPGVATKFSCPPTPEMCSFVFEGYESDLPTIMLPALSTTPAASKQALRPKTAYDENLEPGTLVALLRGSTLDLSDTVADMSRIMCLGGQKKNATLPRFAFKLTPDGHLRYDDTRVSGDMAWLAAAQTTEGAVVRLRMRSVTVDAFGMPMRVKGNSQRANFHSKRNCVLFRVKFEGVALHLWHEYVLNTWQRVVSLAALEWITTILPMAQAEDEERQRRATARRESRQRRREARVAEWVEEIRAMFDEEFEDTFRITREVLDLIAEKMAHPMSRFVEYNNVPLSLCCLIPIKYFASAMTYHDMSFMFGLPKGLIHRIVDCFLVWFPRKFKRDWVQFPSEELREEMALDFRAIKGVPNVIGAIDGTQIEIRGLDAHRSDYYNRKSVYSGQHPKDEDVQSPPLHLGGATKWLVDKKRHGSLPMGEPGQPDSYRAARQAPPLRQAYPQGLP
ncbi:unnamed protein product [Closterium sp. NIES-64]|nr:unnamed protein product [Closterium sp. NIES-64]